MDDGSVDDSAARAAAAGAPPHDVRRAGTGRSPGNLGARSARGEWVLFVDADCEVGPDTLQSHGRGPRRRRRRDLRQLRRRAGRIQQYDESRPWKARRIAHFRSHIVPKARELAPRVVWREVVDHLRLRIPPASGGPHYGLLQKSAYSLVVFVAAPLMALTGLAMSPAVTAAFPLLLRLFGGYQSARTIHFFAFVALLLFVCVHVMMVVMSGFRRQIRAMTVGN